MAAPQASIDYSTGISNAWSDVAAFVPKLAAFLVVLLVGYVVAKVVAKVVDRVLERVGFDRAVERGGIRKALAKSQYDASDLVSKVVYYALMLLVLQMAFGVFGANPVSALLTDIVLYLPKVIAAIVIVVLAASVAAAAKDLISSSLGGLSYGTALANAASIGIVTVGVFAALSQLQIAPFIVNGLFYAILAVVVGSAIVSIGGGGIQPMRQRWEQALSTYDQEKGRLQQEVSSDSSEQPTAVRGRATSDLSGSRTRSTSSRARGAARG